MCTDGSKFSEEAIRFGGKLVKGSKSKAVTLLRVIPVMPEDYQEVDEFAHVFEEEIHKLHMLDVPKSVKRSLDAGQMILEKIGIKAQVKVRKGRPVDEILKEAEEGLYNLIVMASYGKGITKFMLGSVSREVVHRAQIPVLVVKGKEAKSMM